MKKSMAFLFTFFVMGTASQASLPAGLYVKAQDDSLISVAELVQDQVDVQVDYGYEKFCYSGDASQVATKMKVWKKAGYFFSGGGGGFVLKSLKIRRGIVAYSILMTLEDEVVPGELTSVVVNPCR